MSTTAVSKWQAANNAGAVASTAEHQILPMNDLPSKIERTEYKRLVLDTTKCPVVVANSVTANTYQLDSLLETNQVLLVEDTITAANHVRIKLPPADVCAGQTIRIAYLKQVSGATGSLYLEASKNGSTLVPFIGSLIVNDTDDAAALTTIPFISSGNNFLQIAVRPNVNSFIDLVSSGSSWIISGKIRSSSITVTASTI